MNPPYERGDPEDGDLVENGVETEVPEEVKEAVRALIRWAGDDPEREGLLDTPRRVACAWREYAKGYAEDPAVHLTIAYLPKDRVVGISKLARVLHGYARRLQVQERLTAQVADAIWKHLQPKGVAVVIEASHACMTSRGVQTPGVMMTTSRMMGTFREDERSRREVLALMGY